MWADVVGVWERWDGYAVWKCAIRASKVEMEMAL
jgi:hypothetical protein